MKNIYTYNQIVNELKDIALRHYMINSFYEGNKFNVTNQKKEVTYPQFKVNLVRSKLSRNEFGDYPVTRMILNCQVIDKISSDNSDTTFVKSDTLQIVQDIIIEISSNPYFNEIQLSLMEDIDISPLDEYNDDLTTGHEFELEFELFNNLSYCGLPFSEIEGYVYNCSDLTDDNFDYYFVFKPNASTIVSFISDTNLNIVGFTNIVGVTNFQLEINGVTMFNGLSMLTNVTVNTNDEVRITITKNPINYGYFHMVGTIID